MRQSHIFMHGEADAWHWRNREVKKVDDVLTAIVSNPDINPRMIIEVGCGVGKRLHRLGIRYPKSEQLGIEPSLVAIQEGVKYPGVEFRHGSALSLGQLPKCADLLIFGFCLYLCDRDDLFTIVDFADTTLVEGGYIVIHDFDQFPQVVPYHHKEGIFSYKMDHSKLWLANPSYAFVSKAMVNSTESVTIIRKMGWERFK